MHTFQCVQNACDPGFKSQRPHHDNHTHIFTFEKTQSELLEVLGKLKNSGIEQITARSGNRVFRQTDEPTAGMVIGDFWVDTDASPLVIHIFDGSDWDLTFTVS